MRFCKPHTCRPRGFTLIELLVVISLITILLSLLTPVVLTARQTALTANCASNLKNIGLAVNAFTVDHDGGFPTTCGAGWEANNWIYYQNGRSPGMDDCPMAKYLNAKGATLSRIMTCPAQPIEDNIGYSGGGAYVPGAGYPLTYSLNYAVSLYRPLQLRRIHNPAAKILIYDENQNADDDQFWYQTDRDTLAGRHGSMDYQKSSINGANASNTNRGLGNVYFLDGHVGLVDNDYCHNIAYNDLLAP